MTIAIFKTGNAEPHARAIGISLALGNWVAPELDETRRQMNLSIGFWWFIIQWQIWRQA